MVHLVSRCGLEDLQDLRREAVTESVRTESAGGYRDSCRERTDPEEGALVAHEAGGSGRTAIPIA